MGAGFVGWGSYDYGSKGGVVAEVGNKEVTVEEYQQEYSNIYNEYSKMFGPMFSKELAEQLKLKDVAFKRVLEKILLWHMAIYWIYSNRWRNCQRTFKIWSFFKRWEVW